MSLNTLTKEQKQYMVLGALVAVILLIVVVIGIRLSLSSVREAKAELTELEGKIDAADRTLSRRNVVSDDFQATMLELKEQIKNAPPERNYYSWATEVVYSQARMSGLEVDSIDEIPSIQNKSPDETGEELKLESYALRVSAHGGYNNVKAFIKSMKESYPLVRFAGLDMASGASRDKHSVQLWLQWPFNLGKISESWDSVESKQQELALQERENALNAEAASNEAAARAQPQPELKSEPTPPAPRTVPKSATTPPSVRPESVVKVEPGPKSEPTPPEPRVMPKPEPKQIEPIEPQPKPEVTLEPTTEPDLEPTPPEPEPQPEVQVSEPEQVAVVEPQPEPEVTLEPTTEPDLEPTPPEPEPQPEVQVSEPEQAVAIEPEPEPETIEKTPAALELAEPESVLETVTPDVEGHVVPEPEEPSAGVENIEPEEPGDAIDSLLENLQSGSGPDATDEPVVLNDTEPVADQVAEPETVSEEKPEPDLGPSGTSDATDSNYITTRKSAEKLESLLMDQSNTENNESLNSLLDSLIGDQP